MENTEVSKHTPGKWMPINENLDNWIIMAQPHPALRGFTKEIAFVEGDSNARLIAAAPDMHELLKEIYENDGKVTQDRYKRIYNIINR